MRLLLALLLLGLCGAGYVMWSAQNALTPLAQSEQPLTRYQTFTRCAALHGQVDDALKEQGKSTLERLGNMALVELFTFAAKSDQTRGDRTTEAVTGEVNALKAKYASPVKAYVQGDADGLAARDMAHCSDLKEVLQ